LFSYDLANGTYGSSGLAAIRQRCIASAAAVESIHWNRIAGEFVTNKTLQSIKLVWPSGSVVIDSQSASCGWIELQAYS
jgi:hypothetical protein